MGSTRKSRAVAPLLLTPVLVSNQPSPLPISVEPGNHSIPSGNNVVSVVMNFWTPDGLTEVPVLQFSSQELKIPALVLWMMLRDGVAPNGYAVLLTNTQNYSQEMHKATPTSPSSMVDATIPTHTNAATQERSMILVHTN